MERSLSVYWALYWRVVHGGYPFGQHPFPGTATPGCGDKSSGFSQRQATLRQKKHNHHNTDSRVLDIYLNRFRARFIEREWSITIAGSEERAFFELAGIGNCEPAIRNTLPLPWKHHGRFPHDILLTWFIGASSVSRIFGSTTTAQASVRWSLHSACPAPMTWRTRRQRLN